jgi:hypothetical protein
MQPDAFFERRRRPPQRASKPEPSKSIDDGSGAVTVPGTKSTDVQAAQGNLSSARQSYQAALKTQQSLGQKSDAAYSQISLAALALEEKRPEYAKKLAQEAVTKLAAEKDVGGEAQGRGTGACAARFP